MKIGSIVQLEDDNWNTQLKKDSEEYGTVYPIKKKDYTIREIVSENGVTGITLEEIVNPKVEWKSGFHELRFAIQRFRELMPPMKNEIAELIAEPLVA
jgi:PhoPQ-activated pathogenicity-related protein